MSSDQSAVSRQSQTNCHGPVEHGETGDSRIEASDMGGTGLRPISVDGDRELRDEALLVQLDDGDLVPLTAPNVEAFDGVVKSRPWYEVVNQHTRWYEDYRNSHIEFEDPDGETVRAGLQNAYQPEYGDKYYAKLMDLKRGVELQWGDFSMVLLTLSASTLNGNDQPRAPADHMRDIAAGWGNARKHLYGILEGRRWCYARVWEATSGDGHGPAGYGHQHVAIFVEDGDDLEAGDFAPFMRSYVDNCRPAGWEAHRPSGDGVSVVHELEEANAATYISEYIGAYGEELDERSIEERAFLSVVWATNTHRVEFSSDAQEVIRGEEFRRETGLRPQDRGEASGDSEAGEGDENGEDDGDGGDGWTFKRLCEVRGSEPSYYEPTDGVVDTSRLDGAGSDPPRDLGPPPD